MLGTRGDHKNKLPGFQQPGQLATFTVRRKGRNLRKIRWLTTDVQEHLWNSSLEREVRCATWQAWGPERSWRGKSRSNCPSQLPACESQQVQIRAAAGPSDHISFPTSSAPKGLHLPCPAHAKTQVLCLKSLPALILHLPPGQQSPRPHPDLLSRQQQGEPSKPQL